jgi:hypothetical protein
VTWARAVGASCILCNGDHAHTLTRERRSRGQPCRPAAYDQDVCFDQLILLAKSGDITLSPVIENHELYYAVFMTAMLRTRGETDVEDR